MERTKWVDRIFEFNYPPGLLPSVVERLKGTVPRLESITQGVSDEKALERTQGSWSIKEHIGHLVDLEELHIARLREFQDKKPELSAADMQNRRTEEANHNTESTPSLIAAFGQKRQVFVDILTSMDDETQLFQSLHPRLKVYMRPIDVGTFTAEHDDHHLASIREILD